MSRYDPIGPLFHLDVERLGDRINIGVSQNFSISCNGRFVISQSRPKVDLPKYIIIIEKNG